MIISRKSRKQILAKRWDALQIHAGTVSISSDPRGVDGDDGH